MKPLTILFVDDDKFLLDMYSMKFSKSNYTITTAQSPEDALKLIKDGLDPDILLLDIVMPSMDGLEFLSLLRKENLLKKSVIIMLTNQGLPDDIAKAKKLNVDGYIIKATTVPSDVLAEVKKIYSSAKKS
jgi:CheY-like chemotaxis protein